ncbi:hypothetical protein HMPREF1406_01033 [Helicobacter pylori GAM239Bi]|nr:hypothetical protein HMPREF1406_01033 [Helicobacter pylori GAM239Bi]
MKEAIPRHAKEITERMISSEEKSIKANQVKLTEATQNIDKKAKKHNGSGFKIWRNFHSAL